MNENESKLKSSKDFIESRKKFECELTLTDIIIRNLIDVIDSYEKTHIDKSKMIESVEINAAGVVALLEEWKVYWKNKKGTLNYPEYLCLLENKAKILRLKEPLSYADVKEDIVDDQTKFLKESVEDCCVWKVGIDRMQVGCKPHVYSNQNLDWEPFCPFCGRKIKVVEVRK